MGVAKSKVFTGSADTPGAGYTFRRLRCYRYGCVARGQKKGVPMIL